MVRNECVHTGYTSVATVDMLSCTSCLYLLQITVDWQDMPGPDGLLPKPDSALSGVQEARGKVGIAGLLSVYALCFACAKATTAIMSSYYN